MSLFDASNMDFYICDKGFPHIKRERLEAFTASMLGLGDLTTPTEDVDAIAAVFDLSGFTTFCTQIDPQLAISEYLSAFLDWLFASIKSESIVDEVDKVPRKSTKQKSKAKKKVRKSADDGTVPTLATLPFFAKFMGDGVLFLWNAAGLTERTICSLPAVLTQVCAQYELEFLPKICFSVADPPEKLRCGIARGKVFSVGHGTDFVGPCINMASRLQQLKFQIAFSRRGFNAEKFMDSHMLSHFVLKKTSIPGVGDNELIYIHKHDYDDLREEEKILFEEPDEYWRIPSEEELKKLMKSNGVK